MFFDKFKYLILSLLGAIVLYGIYTKLSCNISKNSYSKIKNEIAKVADKNDIKNGDLIFQTSLSSQSKAIQLATKSKYSHCGIIFNENDKLYVFEAIQQVKKTPLVKWIARGENNHYVIKRLKNSDKILTENVLAEMKKEGKYFSGKNYDLAFEWTDDRIYCSELIWKIYKHATGLEIGKLEKLEDFDLSNEIVKAKIKERYGNKIPKDEIVISPRSVYDSKLLETITEN